MSAFPRTLALSVIAALSLGAIAHAQEAANLPGFHTDTVYVMSNDIQANSVAVLQPDFFGGLHKVQVVATGGKGVGVGTTTPPPDPLGSQNALLKSADGRWLYASNAGSNQLSVFAIEGDRLELRDVVNSGGSYPVSVAQRGDRLYVLNAAGQSNVAVFEQQPDGSLRAVGHATRSLGTDQPLVGNQPNVGMTPAQVSVSPDGHWLIAAIKDASGHGTYASFALDRQGDPAAQPVTTVATDSQPFGFAFDAQGHLIGSDGTGSAASSYRITSQGSLQVLSGEVADGQAATCWLVVAGHYAFVTSAGTGTISAYAIDEQGRLSLVGNGVAAKLGNGAAPTDLAVSADGRTLYANDSINGDVDAFLILPGGHLLPIGQTAVFAGASGMQGLAM